MGILNLFEKKSTHSITIPLNSYQQFQLNQSHKYGDQIEQEGLSEVIEKRK